MALKTMLEELSKAKREYDEQLKTIGTKLREDFAKEVAPLIPPGYQLEWTQYTPYFNDGEACTFGVNDFYLVRQNVGDGDAKCAEDRGGQSISRAIQRYGTPDVETFYETDDYSKPIPLGPRQNRWEQKYEKKKVTYINPGFPLIEGYNVAKLQDLDTFMKSIEGDLFLQAFGDHAKVVVTPDGVEVDEYEHE